MDGMKRLRLLQAIIAAPEAGAVAIDQCVKQTILTRGKFVPSERHNESEIMSAPTSSGVSGDGGLGRGRTLVRRERPRFYRANDVK